MCVRSHLADKKGLECLSDPSLTICVSKEIQLFWFSFKVSEPTKLNF